MGRIISIVLVVVVVSYALAFITARREVFAIESSAQGTSVLDAVSAVSSRFSETGTLAFYPNNVGPVPYLFYQNSAGRTVARALSFPNGSPVNFSAWSGGHVFVTGRLENEHVVVGDITYLSAP